MPNEDTAEIAPPPPADPQQEDRLRILSIDGGGIRGIIAASILARIEEQLQEPLCRYFDLVVGTSTGSLIAAGLTAPQPGYPSLPAATAARLLKLYVAEGPRIFPQDRIPIWRSAGALIRGARYSPAVLKEVIASVIGTTTTVEDCLKDIVIPAYDIENRRPVFMSSVKSDMGRSGVQHGAADDEENYRLHEAVLASAAGPTYFPPVEATILNPKPEGPNRRSLVDGGVFANDPALAGCVEALKLPIAGSFPNRKPLVVSVGTGQENRAYAHASARNWGMIQWISPWRGSPIISILMQGQASTASYQLNSFLNGSTAEIKDFSTRPAAGHGWADLNYFRIDGDLKLPGNRSSPDLADLDAAGERNIDDLQTVAGEIITRNTNQIAAIVQRLHALGTPRPVK